MNRKNRIAVLLLVIAIVLSLISVMLRISIDSVSESPKGESAREQPRMEAKGTVQLIVLPRSEGGINNES